MLLISFILAFIFGGERIEVPVGLPLIRDVKFLLEETDPTEKGREAQGVWGFFFFFLAVSSLFKTSFQRLFPKVKQKEFQKPHVAAPRAVLITKG